MPDDVIAGSRGWDNNQRGVPKNDFQMAGRGSKIFEKDCIGGNIEGIRITTILMEAGHDHADRLKRAIERDTGYRFKITPVALPDNLVRRDGEGKVEQRGVPRNDYELAERLADIFDKEVIWMQTSR